MKCGYCGREMLKGYIPTPAIEWIPAYGKSKMRYTGEKEEGNSRHGIVRPVM